MSMPRLSRSSLAWIRRSKGARVVPTVTKRNSEEGGAGIFRLLMDFRELWPLHEDVMHRRGGEAEAERRAEAARTFKPEHGYPEHSCDPRERDTDCSRSQNNRRSVSTEKDPCECNIAQKRDHAPVGRKCRGDELVIRGYAQLRLRAAGRNYPKHSHASPSIGQLMQLTEVTTGLSRDQ